MRRILVGWLGVVTLVVGCSSQAEESTEGVADESALVEIKGDDQEKLIARLAPFTETQSGEELQGGARSKHLQQLNAAISRDPHALKWATQNAALENPAQVALVHTGQGDHIVASRTWRDGTAATSGIRRLIMVVPPTGKAWFFGEGAKQRLAGNGDIERVSLAMYSFDESFRLIASDGAIADTRAPAAPTAPKADTAKKTGGQEYGAGQAGVCFGCVSTVRVASWLGIVLGVVASASGSKATCDKFGDFFGMVTKRLLGRFLKTSAPGTDSAADAAGTSICQTIVKASGIGGAAVTAGNWEASICNKAFGALTSEPLCKDEGPKECSPSALFDASANPGRYCRQMAICARALNCDRPAPELCAHIQPIAGQETTCDKVVARTCAPAAGLYREADFDAACAFILR